MKVSVIGPGSFGTAIAQLISKNTGEVKLFGRNNDIIKSINHEHVNNTYYPLIKLNDNIKAYNISKDVDMVNESDTVIFSVPSGSLKDVIKPLKYSLEDKIIISTIKGIDYPSLKFMTRIIKEETNNENVFSISGPTFADELIGNLLSGMTLGIDKLDYKSDLVKLFKSSNLIMDFSKDVEGVELCGVLKNIYAIAMGIFDSFFYGSNEHYVFLNLCFKEMRTILTKLNYDKNLIFNFCGFGDLNLTACVDKSRNRTLGLMMGKNISLNLDESTITMEGLKSAKSIKEIMEKNGLNLPILNFVNSAFDVNEDIRNSINQLMKGVGNLV